MVPCRKQETESARRSTSVAIGQDQRIRRCGEAHRDGPGASVGSKRGETKKSELKGPAREIYESMTEEQLEDFALTKRTGKPAQVSRS
jgi:hypothetical protein